MTTRRWLVAASGAALLIFLVLWLATDANLLTRLAAAAWGFLLVFELQWARRVLLAFRTGLLSRRRRPRLRLVARVVAIVLSVWAFWVVANIVANPLLQSNRYDRLTLVVVAAGILLVLPAVYVLCRRAGSWLSRRQTARRRAIGLAALIFSIAVQTVLAAAVLRPSGFDSDVIIQAAIGLAHGDRSSFGLSSDYFAWYPNNIFLLVILWAFFAILHGAGIAGATALLWGAVLLNVVALQAGLVLTYLVAKRVAGTGSAIFVAALAIPFVLVSPWLDVPYSDTLGLPFAPALLLIYLSIRNARTTRGRVVLWVVLGIVSAVGYNIKPTIVFVTVGIVIVAFVGGALHLRAENATKPRMPPTRRLLRAATTCLVVIAALVATNETITATENASGAVHFDLYSNELSFPITHFLMMGAGGDGGYSEADGNATRALPTHSAKFWTDLDQYLARVKAMSPSGYADFLGTKALASATDGSFYQWGEGGLTDHPFINTDPAAVAVQDYYGPNGVNRPTLVTLWQALWVVLLLGVAIPLFHRSRRTLDPTISAARIATILLILFLLLFESRSRYFYLDVPLFALMAGTGFGSLFERLRRRILPAGTAVPGREEPAIEPADAGDRTVIDPGRD